jgi:hypothetical protein
MSPLQRNEIFQKLPKSATWVEASTGLELINLQAQHV